MSHQDEKTDSQSTGILDFFCKKMNFWNIEPDFSRYSGNPDSTSTSTATSSCPGGQCSRNGASGQPALQRPLSASCSERAQSYGSCRPCSMVGAPSSSSSGNSRSDTSTQSCTPAASAYCSRSILPPCSKTNTFVRSTGSGKEGPACAMNLGSTKISVFQCNVTKPSAESGWPRNVCQMNKEIPEPNTTSLSSRNNVGANMCPRETKPTSETFLSSAGNVLSKCSLSVNKELEKSKCSGAVCQTTKEKPAASIAPFSRCNNGEKNVCPPRTGTSRGAFVEKPKEAPSQYNLVVKEAPKETRKCSRGACQIAKTEPAANATSRAHNVCATGTSVDRIRGHTGLRIGDTVLVTASSDRHEPRSRGQQHFWGVILYITDDGLFKIGTRKGKISRLVEASETRPASTENFSMKDVPDKSITFKEACSMSF